MKITAVVVTYNRFNLLKQTIRQLRNITQLNQIIVVNNGSTDETPIWLDQQTDLTVIHQDNLGGSGGFYTGMKHAYDTGADYLWCMDDDVYPEADCLTQLLAANHTHVGILCPRRIQAGKTFVNECRKINLSNPFTSLHRQKLTPGLRIPTPIEAMVFEGPLIKREVVTRIGYPNKDLFIFYDDTDYAYRTVLAGFQILYVPDAHMQKARFFSHDTWKEKSRKKKWKRMYQVRNSAYFNHHYGRNLGVRYGRAFLGMIGYVLLVALTAPFVKAYHCKDIRRFWNMYRDGIRERLGKL